MKSFFFRNNTIRRIILLAFVTKIMLIVLLTTTASGANPSNLKQYVGNYSCASSFNRVKEVGAGHWINKTNDIYYYGYNVSLVVSKDYSSNYTYFEVRKSDEPFTNQTTNYFYNPSSSLGCANFVISNNGSDTALAEARYKWQVKTGGSGWVKYDQSDFHFGIDITPPEVFSPLVSNSTPSGWLGNGPFLRGKIPMSAASVDNLSGLKAINFYLGTDTRKLLFSSPLSPASFIWDSSNLNGNHLINIRPIDIAGSTTTPPNIAAASFFVKLDNYRPKTFIKTSTLMRKRRKRIVGLLWRVEDPHTEEKAYVKLLIEKKIKSKKKLKKGKKKAKSRFIYKKIKMKDYGLTVVNKYNNTSSQFESLWRSFSFVTLSKGQYRARLFATDQASNPQENVALTYFSVK